MVKGILEYQAFLEREQHVQKCSSQNGCWYSQGNEQKFSAAKAWRPRVRVKKIDLELFQVMHIF